MNLVIYQAELDEQSRDGRGGGCGGKEGAVVWSRIPKTIIIRGIKRQRGASVSVSVRREFHR